MTTGLPHDSVRAAWTALRTETPLLHLDTAACGRTTVATWAAIARHLELEAELGGYVAEAEADGAVTEARQRLGELLGGFDQDEVALLDSSSTAVTQLLAAWPCEAGDEVWIAPSEWGPNIEAFRYRGLEPVVLDVDGSGLIDLEALRRRLLTKRPAMVHLTGLTAHRALAQPAREIVEIAGDVPVVIDTAQALGQIEIPAGVAAVYGTSRKWLCGPRGVGYLAVREPWQGRLVPRVPALAQHERPVRNLESHEAYVAGRVGLATTLREYVGIGPALIRERLAAVGRELRSGLADLPGWSLRDPIDAPGAIVALVPDTDLNLFRLRADLLDRKMLTTVSAPARAPLDITRPMLRLSPHVDFEIGEIPRIRALLAA
ncbi:aminotransferase class V-fold PLP-dependent enzyme [Kutzneria sp. CA-103260]|uniref:aminotransferase class V-fold PLP-dependent enzyme n=1 Tax=Kutzneria sp. CA-103260 TaxID=2802641 RepID=UPI001BA59BF5|nr:aminotransferase class V-fold PLP-dependent enzyme [Kutzneria sp. CA-103260]